MFLDEEETIETNSKNVTNIWQIKAKEALSRSTGVANFGSLRREILLK